MNRSFRQSISFDSDQDGIANGYDLSPFGNGIPKIVSVSVDKENKISIKWMGLPSSLYRIEYKEKVMIQNGNCLRVFNDEYIVEKLITRRYYLTKE